jgi:prevent-host-death family protein
MQLNVLDAKTRLSELIRRAQAGEEVIIAHRGRAVVRLAPVCASETAEPRRGSASAILDWLAATPPPDDTRRDAEAIEADIDAGRAAWD